MKLTWRRLDLRLARTFTISRSSADVRHNVLVELEAGGVVGRGEAEPTPFYGETAEGAVAALEGFDPAPLGAVERGAPVAEVVAECAGRLGRAPSVVAALDAALWDVRGKQLGQPVWKLLGAPATCPVPTSFTIGMADPAAMAEVAAQVRDRYRILKIKVGGERDLECLAAIRAVTDAPIRVDANAAWTGEEAAEKIEAMARFGIELVEQPCARGDTEGLRRARDASPVPVIADESCHTTADLDRLARAVDGVNIKLVKSGGLCEAARIVRRARELGLKLMIGCMTSSSLAITTAAHIAGWMDFVDLDGNLLLAEDPFAGATVEDGTLQVPTDPGLGVRN
ncbi:MAG: dipeptide epimerase [bacterium]